MIKPCGLMLIFITSSSVRLALFAIQSYVEFTVATVIACKHACL
jgi:hypothetical protein